MARDRTLARVTHSANVSTARVSVGRGSTHRSSAGLCICPHAGVVAANSSDTGHIQMFACENKMFDPWPAIGATAAPSFPTSARCSGRSWYTTGSAALHGPEIESLTTGNRREGSICVADNVHKGRPKERMGGFLQAVEGLITLDERPTGGWHDRCRSTERRRGSETATTDSTSSRDAPPQRSARKNVRALRHSARDRRSRPYVSQRRRGFSLSQGPPPSTAVGARSGSGRAQLLLTQVFGQPHQLCGIGCGISDVFELEDTREGVDFQCFHSLLQPR